MVYLIDTSAWIVSFSPSIPTPFQSLLEEALDEDRVWTCGVVIAELLQGCRNSEERNLFKDRFGSLPHLSWKEEDWLFLGETSAELRSKGVSVPLIDLMIALLAIRHRATLLHRDRHYDLMAGHLPLSAQKV